MRTRMWMNGSAIVILSVVSAAGLMALASGCAGDKRSEPGPEARKAAEPARIYDGYAGYARTVTTDSAEAQQWFNQGIQLLYGFNHDEAIRSFHKAAEIDPECAMAWWGVAYAHGMHINNPVMGEEQSRLAYEAAQEALARLDGETAVERALVEAVSRRYAWPVPEDRSALDEAYASAMGDVYGAFPGDADVGALYAESMMDLQPWDLWTHDGEPKKRALEIVEVLEKAMAIAPDHPGANHFYIHAIEASPWPEKGTAAAERLGGLVPGSGHLVHMPSHIYIRTGRYADAADSNVRAIEADEAYFAKAPAPDFYSLYYMHNTHFLAYAAMMEGRRDTALAAARKIETNIPESFLKERVKIADGFMPTTLQVMVRFGMWEEILEEPAPPKWRKVSTMEHHFARTVALANLDRTREARQELKKLERATKGLEDGWFMGNNAASHIATIATEMAKGEVLFREGKRDEAFVHLRKAVENEMAMTYDEPPGWMLPVRHALGALLLADGRAAEAEQVYREDLARHPNNGWSLLGLRQSLEAQGKPTDVDGLDQRFAAAWARADVTPHASCYCSPE